jgi:nucleoside-diphosphate-sugar epimerase
MGVDTVISTVTGVPGMELLKASVQQGVRRFAPAEFEGLPSRRPHNDPLDRDNSKASIRLWLDHYRTQRQIESTIFTCGVLYERFGPGGLRAHRLGLNSHLDGEGDFIINVRHMTATAPVYDASNQPNVTVCLTAAEDVARFVVKALDLSRWPEEMTMVGERLTVLELLRSVERARRMQLILLTCVHVND